MRKLSIFLILLTVFALASPAAFAQTATYTTVLSAALNGTQTNVTVASMTNMVASSQTVTSLLFCDGELMKINAINTTTLVATVQRGYDITRAPAPPITGTHPSGSQCWYGVGGTGGGGTGGPFITQRPQPGVTCDPTNYPFLPLINIAENSLSYCNPWSVNSSGTKTYRWATNNIGGMFSWSHPLTSVYDAAYTAILSDEFIRMAHMTAGRTVTLPAITGIVGKVVIVKHDANAQTLTVAATAGQFVTTVGTTSTTASAGGTIKLMSVQSTTGAWGWMTVY